jgi:hypothetical protein
LVGAVIASAGHRKAHRAVAFGPGSLRA